MKHWIVIGMLFLGVSIGVAHDQDQLYIDEVLAKLKSENYTNALQMLNKKIQNEEWQLQYMHELRGESYFGLESYKEARDEYIRALPQSNEGRVERKLGQTYDKLGEFHTAVEYYDKCIEMAPDEGFQEYLARYHKARALASLGKYTEARMELKKINNNTISEGFIKDVREMMDFCLEQEKKATGQATDNGGSSESSESGVSP
ncbi:tetratricopeptide repeat protein [Pontiella sulfatireligans]|uniref:Tetratricopeptide repeat protein n=1 Tax=Pontiella sulfatireligans TaxID=2750658 RepID=A0A6C2USP9_9BACT|nr:tetratricopeptide repeat protein [Pontiella sulfatireligans]VGO23288.1 hypothetical protein SCARR_05395 [Pontiella sulfatireligans]